MDNPLISIIVPIYNVEKYLPKCVESIAHQTYRNLEIILVDDGSPDRCGEMCDQYAVKDSRIKVIHKQNGGLSDARNVAIDVAKGEYITFVDSDDYISTYFIEFLFVLIRRTKADIAECSYVLFYEDSGMKNSCTPKFSEFRLYTGDNAIKNVFYQKNLNCSAWGKLYKKSLFKTIRYPKGLLFEDLAIIYPLLKQVRTLVYTRMPLYYYLARPTSILGNFTLKRTDVLDILDNLETFVSNSDPKFLKAVISRNISAHFNILGLVLQSPKDFVDIKMRCWSYIRRNRRLCLLDSHVRIKNKIGILISFGGINILKAFFYFNHR